MTAPTAVASAIPRATARFQLHQDFGFDAAREQVPYLAGLGISHLYTSPILVARAGSMHGYDVVDHRSVSAELGGEDALRRLSQTLHEAGMGLIVDIVPNHMAVGGADNPWWLDVLESGASSPFARFFDIDWNVPDPALAGKLLAPFLGKPYGEALEDGEIVLGFESGRFHAQYFEHRFPIAPETFAEIFARGGETLEGFASGFASIHERGSPRAGRRGRIAELARSFAERASEPAIAGALARALSAFDAREAAGRERLHRLLERQHYRLAWWRTAADEINWRRFFDVISLAGLRMEEPAAFEATHAVTFRLYAEGVIDGVRVDHVDGLADPRGYCRRLRARLSRLAAQRPAHAPRGQAWVVVEKILAPGETLRRDWRVDGTTGYTFMNEVDALLHDPAGEEPLTALWVELSGRSGDFTVEVRSARRRTVEETLGSEYHATARALHRIARSRPATRDVTQGAIRRVLMELLVNFPVYRIYADRRGRAPEDEALMARVRDAARAGCRPAERPFVDVVDRWLGGEAPSSFPTEVERRQRLTAIGRFQQLSSPVAAKAVEDTAFYRHGRLLSRNEVGADPAQFSMSIDDFHAANLQRRRRFPATLLATATHDHKRGEDARARLAAISEMPAHWETAVRRWKTLNAGHRAPFESAFAPDGADEYMLYQMLVAAWPPGLRPDDADGLKAYAERLAGWQEKAVREAKLRSGWIEPNADYEGGCRNFLFAIADPARSAAFLTQAHALVEALGPPGAINGLAQTLLRMTTPGIPDLYQGTELWDSSLVDPDNRRPVDFAARARMLEERDRGWGELLSNWHDGAVKQRLIARTLAFRRRHAALFAEGDYIPLPARGRNARRVVAFARLHGDTAAIVAIPRFSVAVLRGDGSARLAPDAFEGAHLPLSRGLPQTGWTDVLDGGAPVTAGATLSLESLLRERPFALIVASAAQ